MSHDLGPYDSRDAENVDGIAEYSQKNGIYSLTQNDTEFVKSLDEFTKVGHYTEIKSQYGLVSVNIKLQKSI